MYKNIVDVSSARQNLSKLIDSVYLGGETVVIAKRNIPLVKIIKVDQLKDMLSTEPKSLDLSLFGILKNKKRNAIAIANQIRNDSWRAK